MFSLSPRTQAILLTLGIFALGLVCGAIAERRFLRDIPFMRDGHRPPGGRGNFNAGRQDDRIIERISRDLELSDEQKAALQTAFLENRQEIDTMRRQVGDTMRSQEQKLHKKFKTILTPEQFDKFEEKNKRRGFRGGRGGGRGGGRRGPPGPPR
jgi:Spy/CpxP family protein refolding chaperone